MSFEDSVLICDEVDPVLTKILTDNGLKISYEPEITPEQILEKISTFNFYTNCIFFSKRTKQICNL